MVGSGGVVWQNCEWFETMNGGKFALTIEKIPNRDLQDSVLTYMGINRIYRTRNNIHFVLYCDHSNLLL